MGRREEQQRDGGVLTKGVVLIVPPSSSHPHLISDPSTPRPCVSSSPRPRVVMPFLTLPSPLGWGGGVAWVVDAGVVEEAWGVEVVIELAWRSSTWVVVNVAASTRGWSMWWSTCGGRRCWGRRCGSTWGRRRGSRGVGRRSGGGRHGVVVMASSTGGAATWSSMRGWSWSSVVWSCSTWRGPCGSVVVLVASSSCRRRRCGVVDVAWSPSWRRYAVFAALTALVVLAVGELAVALLVG